MCFTTFFSKVSLSWNFLFFYILLFLNLLWHWLLSSYPFILKDGTHCLLTHIHHGLHWLHIIHFIILLSMVVQSVRFAATFLAFDACIFQIAINNFFSEIILFKKEKLGLWSKLGPISGRHSKEGSVDIFRNFSRREVINF